MPKQNETKIVPFTKEQMFDLVSNIDSYSEFLPWCNASKVIKREIKDNEEEVIADLEIGYDQLFTLIEAKFVYQVTKVQ